MEDKVQKSFPEAREYLSAKVFGTDYPTKHLIEQARSKGFITRGKSGRGAEAVSSTDIATLVCASLAGDTPQAATDALDLVKKLYPNTSGLGPNERVLGFDSDEWREWNIIETITALIDQSRRDFEVDHSEISITVTRIPALYGKISWNSDPRERDEFLIFEQKGMKRYTPNGRRRINVSYSGEILRNIADWFEDRIEH
jgi:hypothetical protein